jgi:hypothetical protein
MQMALTRLNVRNTQGMAYKANLVWCQCNETILTKHMASMSIDPSRHKEQ